MQPSQTPTRIRIVLWFGLAVGVGSMCFHGSLTKVGQLLDELPMLFCASSYLYNIIFVLNNSKSKTYNFLSVFAAGVLMAVNISLVLLMVQRPKDYEMFLNAFTAICVVSYFGEFYSIWWYASEYFYYSISGCLMFLVGFLLWNIENQFCQQVEFLHLHSFWHLFTAFAISMRYHVLLFVYFKANKYKVDFVVNWPFRFFFPKVNLLKD